MSKLCGFVVPARGKAYFFHGDRDPATADVVTVDGPNGARVQLHRLAAHHWAQLTAAARADGHADPLLLPVSGYRSSATQQRLFDQAVERYGSVEEARRWVAPPGGSAHQSGRAVDFGFYPYSAEPWHWEYDPPTWAPVRP